MVQDLVIRLRSADPNRIGGLSRRDDAATGFLLSFATRDSSLQYSGNLGLAALALNSPWGRMMRAIRDNEIAAMGKDVTNLNGRYSFWDLPSSGLGACLPPWMANLRLVLISLGSRSDLGNGHHRRKCNNLGQCLELL